MMFDNPLLGLLGFSGPADNNQLLGIASGDWPPRWWKRIMGQDDTPQILPPTVASGVQSRARQLLAADQQVRASDISHGVPPARAQSVGSTQYYMQTAQNEYNRALAGRQEEHQRATQAQLDRSRTNSRIVQSLEGVLGNNVAVHQVPDYLLDVRPGSHFLTHTTGATVGSSIFIPPGGDGALPHELGHVFENTNANPELLKQIQDDRYQYLSLPGANHSYAAKSGEYTASVFEVASSLINQTSKDTDTTGAARLVKSVDQRMPGVRAVYNWMLSQPEFSWHPLAQLQTLPTVTVRHP